MCRSYPNMSKHVKSPENDTKKVQMHFLQKALYSWKVSFVVHSRVKSCDFFIIWHIWVKTTLFEITRTKCTICYVEHAYFIETKLFAKSVIALFCVICRGFCNYRHFLPSTTHLHTYVSTWLRYLRTKPKQKYK